MGRKIRFMGRQLLQFLSDAIQLFIPKTPDPIDEVTSAIQSTWIKEGVAYQVGLMATRTEYPYETKRREFMLHELESLPDSEEKELHRVELEDQLEDARRMFPALSTVKLSPYTCEVYIRPTFLQTTSDILAKQEQLSNVWNVSIANAHVDQNLNVIFTIDVREKASWARDE
ncbi:hypothetical protein [Alloscardovia omnicolens]|uniref:hypothetical protein n=1 Tax=Alloscardovia omnicolens TaxID=419015 RepID=UPI0003B4911A|nr:hypothetical protein [Alloscardovia omnicolens]